MHTEVKIGLAVGLTLLLLVIVYVSVVGEDSRGRPGHPAPTGIDEAADISRVEVAGDDEPIAPPIAAERITPEVAPILRPALQSPTTRPSAVIREYEPIVAAPTPTPDPLRQGPQVSPPRAPGLLMVPAQPPARPIPTPAQQPRTYVVKATDNQGFWGIAIKVYGDGRRYPLIVKANPGVAPERLRAGQRLVIPPLPARSTSVGRSDLWRTATRDGSRLYTVLPGDAGFWEIAKKMYGHGKHWPHIRRANPGIDPYNLKIGQQLLIPPLSRGIGSPSPTTRSAFAPTRRRTYTVQAGDAGFWEIAKKVYGDGKYHKLIANANPNVDTNRLRPGQKLILPAIGSTVQPSVGTYHKPERSASDAHADDKPTFD